MKVNEAPEKLYIALNELTKDCHTFVLDHHVDYPICTEYTRTDAFIEKAEEYIKQHWIWNTKMIEDFRKYMKGE